MGENDFEIINVAASPSLGREFIEFPKHLYRESDYYVPMFDVDMRLFLKKRHPYFLHSEGDFLLLRKNGKTLGRCLVAENNRYNNFHKTNFAFFDFFDIVDDMEAADYLFTHLCQWTKDKGLSSLVGPMLSGGSSGAGILVQGYEYTPAMTMMRYNYPYYQKLLENLGFTKYVDLHSFSVPPEHFTLSDRIARIAEIVQKRGQFKVIRFTSKGEIKKVISDIKNLYSTTLNHHLEDYPLSEEELDQVEKDLLTVVDPELITLLSHDDRIIGYVFGFADISRTLRRNKGRLGIIPILRIISALKKSDKILFNGIGILPEFQRLGGNALLYQELEHMVAKRNFKEVEMVQISEKTELMISDASKLGAKPFKIHRMYRKDV